MRPLLTRLPALTVVLLLAAGVPCLPLSLVQRPVVAQTNPDHKAEADRLLKQGIQQLQTSQYEAALQSSQQALDIYRSLQDSNGEANALNNLGYAYRTLSQFDKAIAYYQKALPIFVQVKNRSGEALTLGSLGELYLFKQQYKNAIFYYQQSLPIFVQTKDHNREATVLMSMGTAYWLLSQYGKAIDHDQQALLIYQQIKDSYGEARVLVNMGTTYQSISQYDKAIASYQQALPIFQQVKDRYAKALLLSNLGSAYESLLQHDKAIAYKQQALSIYQQVKDPNSEAGVLNDLGNTYQSLSQYDKAIASYQQALSIFIQLKSRTGEAVALTNLGNAYSFLLQYEKAIASYQKALPIFRQFEDRQDEASVLTNLGSVFQQQEQSDVAIVLYKQSVNVRESIRQDIQKLPREEQQSYTQSVAETYRRLASLLLQHERVMEALQVLDLLKVQELQDFFKDVKGNERTAKGIEMLPEEQQILSRLDTSNLNQYLKSTPVTALVAQLRQTATAQGLKLAAYTNLQTRLQNLGKDSALLYPLILKDRIELVLFTHNGPPIHRTAPIDQTKLEQTIQSFRAAIQQKDSQDIRQPANQLYNWLIQPIAADLKQANIKTLIYAPDGQMRYVPLAALYDGQHWLVEKYQINYVTALSLTKLDQRSSQPPRILAGAFTDKDANVSINGQHFVFGAIPFALPEVEDLNKQFPNATKLLTGKAFNRSAMTSDRINGYSIVHLATHGKLVSGAPEASFILLNNNEYITLRDIKDWKLPNVALVVLSACQTALGDKLGNGIEVIGFGYQLQQAQARASIATLWEISDASTGNLMNEFYARLQSEHLSPVEALREAQVALITGKGQASGASKPRTSVNYSSGQNQAATISRDLSHPYYWAPFILIGNGL